MAQITLDVEAVLTGINIDPNGPRLFLRGFLREVGQPDSPPIREFYEDVTGLLTAQQLTYIEAIVTRAQAWLASKVG